MTKLFVVERRSTYVIEAESYEDALNELTDLGTYGTEVFESESMHEASLNNTSKQWADCEPSNSFNGRKLKDIAPEIFGIAAQKGKP